MVAWVKRYPLVAATLVVGIAVLALLAVGEEATARWTASVFALAVGVRIGIDMVRDLLRGHWGIDVLALTAILATVAVGEYLASLIICLMLSGGEALEDYASVRAKRELTSLLERVPQQAHRLLDGDGIEDIALDQVQPGDHLLLRPAEVVPVDAVLLADEADFDESSLTGESLPVTRRRGESVLSGALNGPSAVRIQATARAEDSQYARIVELVREAAASRAPVVRLADRYAVPFTLFAYVVGALAWWLSGDPVRFAEVLVVATPCPLLIAAPVAFMAGMSRAAHLGVIVKDAGTLEHLANVKTAAFDKTGTLTVGRPELVAVRPAGAAPVGVMAYDGGARLEPPPPGAHGETEGAAAGHELLRLAASAEQYSSHVLAESVIRAARAAGAEPAPGTEAHEEATHGVEATIGGRKVVVGKERYVRQLASGVEHYEPGPGEMAVYVGVDGAFAGVLVMSDQLRPDAAATMAELDRLGVHARMMLTGDQQGTAVHVAAQLGLTDTRAECLPEDKVIAVRDAPARPVMAVGDGVNDAPVLAAADVGVAMGARGSTAASESADVVIMTEDIHKAATAIAVGQRTVRVALESIWLGIALSVVLMLVAATGVLPAVFGAMAQEMVDLVTILNALRALRGRPARARVG